MSDNIQSESRSIGYFVGFGSIGVSIGISPDMVAIGIAWPPKTLIVHLGPFIVGLHWGMI